MFPVSLASSTATAELVNSSLQFWPGQNVADNVVLRNQKHLDAAHTASRFSSGGLRLTADQWKQDWRVAELRGNANKRFEADDAPWIPGIFF